MSEFVKGNVVSKLIKLAPAVILFISVLNRLNQLNNRNVGIVVGATQESDMRLIREQSPFMSWLIPGIGKQGGNLESSINIGNQSGACGIINVSRAIIYAGDGLIEDISKSALNYTKQIRSFL